MPTLDVIIVNWNAGEQLRRALQSVAASHREAFALGRVVVVDNASTDGSLELLAGLDLPLVVLRNDANRGFAAACNQGAAASTADYLLFLNPDTQLPAETLDRSVRFMEDPASARVGLMGVQLVDEAGRVSRTCARFPEPRHLLATMVGLDRVLPRRFPGLVMTEWDHAASRDVDHVMGAYFFTRRALFEQLGGFDEGFFVYIEDVDYALRVRQAGWRTHYLAGVRAVHTGCGTSDQVKARRLAYALRSRLYYAFKHYRRPQAVAHLLGTLTVEFGIRLVHALLRGSRSAFVETLAAYRLLVADLPGRRARPSRT